MVRRGAILVTSLWTLTILSVIAAGLTHRASVELRRARVLSDRLAAEHECRSMVMLAIAAIRQENQAQAADGITIEDLGARINLRFQGRLDKPLLEELLVGSGMAENEAADISDTVTDWTDVDDVVGQTEDQEPEFYKNEPFRDPRELSAVMEYYFTGRGEADPAAAAGSVYGSIEKKLSVYPEEGLNINTACADNLRTFCSAALKDAGMSELLPAVPALVDKILQARRDAPFQSAVAGEVTMALLKYGLTQEETSAIQAMDGCFEAASDHFLVMAAYRVGDCAKRVAIVYSSHGDNIVGWHEN